MKPLTLFILPGDQQGHENDPKKALKSFGDLVDAALIKKTVKIDNMTDWGNADWYGYIYDDEYIDDSLRDALSTYFESSKADVLALMKIYIDEHGVSKTESSPRMFRQHVKLNGLIPEDLSVPCERVLDGWIKERDRQHQSQEEKDAIKEFVNVKPKHKVK